jgi:hypothetical protein
MAGGKRLALGRSQIGEHEGDFSLELGAEHVNDALELGAIRSPREEYLDDGGLLADDLETAIPRSARENNHGPQDG